MLTHAAANESTHPTGRWCGAVDGDTRTTWDDTTCLACLNAGLADPTYGEGIAGQTIRDRILELGGLPEALTPDAIEEWLAQP